MEESLRFLLRTRADTLRWGAALGRLLQPGDVVALLGDLGAGKTTLVQGLAQGLGITEPVTSPTFTLAHEYPAQVPLFHFDPYRLNAPGDMVDLGFEEYLERGGVVVVEWADKIETLLPEDRLTVRLELLTGPEVVDTYEETARQLEVAGAGVRSRQLLLQFAALPEVAAFAR